MDGNFSGSALVLRAEGTVNAAELALSGVDAGALSAAERDLLLDYRGVGPLIGLFADDKGAFADPALEPAGRRLQALLSPRDYAMVRSGVLTSYYTPAPIVQVMVDAARALGAPDDAAAVEPGAGCGRFLDAAPAGWRWTAVERDPVAARIMALRHPEATVLAQDLRDVRLPAEGFGLAIGNVPFGDVSYRYGSTSAPLSEFAILTAIESLAPGGLAILLASRYVLDKRDDMLRRLIGRRARLIDARRLPSEVFAADGAQVVSDLLVFRREPEPDDAAPWFEAVPVDVAGDGQLHAINRVFVDEPTRVLGVTRLRSGPFGPVLDVAGDGALLDGLEAWRRSLQPLAGVPAGGSPSHAGERTRLLDGTLTIAADGAILCAEAGRLAPATARGATLRADGASATERKVAALIRMVELRQTVIELQKTEADASEREAARARLRNAYERFVKQFGPINRVKTSVTEDGAETRRLTNLPAPFRHDPRAMLAASLEDYDEDADTATPAAIMLRDTISVWREPTSASDPEEALVISQNVRGKIDLPFMAALCGSSESEVADRLASLIYRDPDDGRWVESGEYLSGDVREKLRIAREAAAVRPEFQRNVEALEPIQPEPLTAGEIEIRLGSPVLDPEHVEDFAKNLLRTDKGVSVARLASDNTWKISADYFVRRSVAATVDFGTSRMSAVEILEAACCQRQIVIADEVSEGGKTKRVRNDDETMAAQEKRDAIVEKFKDWIFSDKDRTDEIVARYNERLNSLRVRSYYGQHITIPGMAQGMSLRPHQKNAVWRALSSPENVMLAHFVGAGKTAVFASIAIRLRQLGLARRPLIVVPNHLTTQVGAEIVKWFPEARVMVAEKEDFTLEGQRRFLGKVQQADADAIVVSHSGFERIAVSPEAQREFIEAEVATLRNILIDLAFQTDDRPADKRLRRMIEARAEKYEDRLRNICTARKDQAIYFEDLGIDYLVVDEAHAFKNLSFTTKINGLAGLNPEGSQRAEDMHMKVRLVERTSQLRGPVCFATATPIANSVAEIWTMLRFLAPRILKKAGIDAFDSFAATFCEIVSSIEVSSDGLTLKPQARLARFVNLPELLTLWMTVADVVTADMAPIPRPTLRGGGVEIRAVSLTNEGREIQQELVTRLQNTTDKKKDNALAITTDGRLLAVDPRLLRAQAAPGNKIGELADEVAAIWRDTAADRGVQLIFCDIGVNPSPRTQFCFWDALIDEIAARGVPRTDIVTSRSEMATPVKEKRAHDDLRAGRKRIALFSTARGGTGLNVQRRLVALHNVDACWRPCDQEQRNGRILRTGNVLWEKYGGVRILQWVTTNSLEGRIYGSCQQKSIFIGSVMKADVGQREIDDISAAALSFAEIKSVVLGEPAIMAEAEITGLVRKLTTLRSMHDSQQWRLRRRKTELEVLILDERKRLLTLGMDRARFEANRDAPTQVHGASAAAMKEPGKALDRAVLDAKMAGGGPVATVRGFTFRLVADAATREWTLEGDGAHRSVIEVGKSFGGHLINRVEALVDSIPRRAEAAAERLDRYEAELTEVEAKIGATFDSGMIDRLRNLHVTISTELAAPPEKRDRQALDAAVADFNSLKTATEQAEKSAARKRDVARSAAETILSARQGKVADESAPPAPDAVAAEAGPTTPAPAEQGGDVGDGGPAVSLAEVRAAKDKPEERRRSRATDPRQGWLFPDVA